MELSRHADVVSFVNAARSFLVSAEAKHALMLGHIGYLERGSVDATGAYFATLHDADSVIGAALELPNQGLVVTSLPHPAVILLAADLRELIALPNVHAPSDTARAFARAWSTCTGAVAERAMTLVLHACERVALSVPRIEGMLRLAGESDLDLVTAWSEAFCRDAGLPGGIDQRPAARKHIAARRTHLWSRDGVPVSMAIATGETHHSMRIGGVFTPNGLRGRGYATACVAALTDSILQTGKHRCVLYTDIANPTSNAIYRRIGYRPIAEYEEWRFTCA